MAMELATTDRRGVNAFEPSNFGELVRFAEYISESGLVPTHLRGRPKDIVLIALRAKELGIPMVSAMSMIYLVEGRVSLSAELWVAIVKRHPECEYFRLVESTDERAVYESKRRGAAPVRLEYTIAQAKQAGLAGKGTWQKHPAAMLRARCATGLARAEFPDAALGMLEHDEAEEITGRPVPVAEPPQRVDVQVAPGPGIPAAAMWGEDAAESPELGPNVFDAIRDDLGALGWRDDGASVPVTLDEAAAIWLDHKPSLTPDTAKKAWALLLKASNARSTAALKRAVEDATKPATPADNADMPANDAAAESA